MQETLLKQQLHTVLYKKFFTVNDKYAKFKIND